MAAKAKTRVRERDGRITDNTLREREIAPNMHDQAFRLAQRRTVGDAKDRRPTVPATSIGFGSNAMRRNIAAKRTRSFPD